VTRVACRIAVIAVVVLLTNSCSKIGIGPLGNGGTRGSICAAVRPGVVLSYGVTDLRNSSSSPAVIDKVSLVSARHLQMVAAWVVPITGHQDYGVWDGYPPAPHQSGVMWSQHTRAAGAVIQPSHGQAHANLVQVLQPTGPVGKAQATDVFYHVRNTQYRMQVDYGFVLLVSRHLDACNHWPPKQPT
jgi:hypothetical protein